ncbi:hypothetical protein NNJEOMEG_03473 [Fundidesulfovibrio magnetotacticus]|uniref:Membrane iron-sulfur containing protein FtrD-like domain-containing protein n=1 Tax=Fundidesulfovibrio magnetotacticus TaxID=2730080 RepID=A0A6V8M521_9BACT|nr:DUF2318 domain-containing protein [Fundidesulfovibrio magnetotacticus]GFK95605.1 hypothetical protein NNJEOMEG_03473 [Fundidesulfovibrio magnetotacticus]
MKRLLLTLTLLLSLPFAASAADDSVRIPLKDVSETAKFYKHDEGGVTVKYFLIKAPDGTVRVALDACDVCYPEKKGYKQQGEFMVCVNCGMKFHVSRVSLVKGGCNPHPVASKVEGDMVVIPKAELAAGVKYFK